MKAVYIETGTCILHSLMNRLGTEGIEPIMVVTPAILVGIKMAHSGRLPPLCDGCSRYLHALCSVNGVELVEMPKEDADAIRAATGSPFVDLSQLLPPGSKEPPS